MAKDDYFVLAYRLLSHLYACLKAGETPDWEYLSYETKAFPIGEAYWNYLLEHLLLEEYIERARLVATGRFQITPKGIAYLQENYTMQKRRCISERC